MGLRNEERLTRIHRDAESDKYEVLQREIVQRQESMQELTRDIYAYQSCVDRMTESLVNGCDGPVSVFCEATKIELDTMRHHRDEGIEELDGVRRQLEESKTRIKLLSDKLENLRNDPE